MEITAGSSSVSSNSQPFIPYVRLAELEVMPAQMENFKVAAIDIIQSTLTEEGVVEFYALIKHDDVGKIVVFEVYKSREAYEAHISSLHYKKFGVKVGTMVKTKTLYYVLPVILAKKPLSLTNAHVRIAELDIDPTQLDAYQAAVAEEINTWILEEPDVLAIYSVAFQDNPSKIRFLEFYANEQAYLLHRETPHFQKYLAVTKPMIKSLKLFGAELIIPMTRSVTYSPVQMIEPNG